MPIRLQFMPGIGASQRLNRLKRQIMKSQQSGFTLLELMMVVAIIGILGAIALPSYKAYIYRAKAVEIVEVLDKLHTVLAGFQAEKGPIGEQYCVMNAPASSPAALKYTAVSPSGMLGEVVGMSQAELSLNHSGVKVSVASCQGSPASYRGQYIVILHPLHPIAGTEARQVAMAVQHVMQRQAVKTQVTSQGWVMLTFQI